MRDQTWFEMADLKRKKLSSSVWIPLISKFTSIQEEEFGLIGYRKELLGVVSLAVDIKQKDAMFQFDWQNINLSHNYRGFVENEQYLPADIYKSHDDQIEGIFLVMIQPATGDLPESWHLHQDLVLTLGLFREDDLWICPSDGYLDVARLKRDSDDAPTLFEIRSEYLRDYLCARNMGLYATSYSSRDLIVDDVSFMNWCTNPTYSDEIMRWRGCVSPIHEGSGHPYGSTSFVTHVARTDADVSDDVPDISNIPTEGNIEHQSFQRSYDGRKLYRVSGELWRKEWLGPSATSPRVRGDKSDHTVYFIVSSDGSTLDGDSLIRIGKWLWFKPEVIVSLYHRRDGSLSFYTQETGGVGCSDDSEVHFGVNDIGLVNVYAKDIGLLPNWQQKSGLDITYRRMAEFHKNYTLPKLRRPQQILKLLNRFYVSASKIRI